MANKNTYVNTVVDFIKSKYADKINRVVIYGDFADPNIINPTSFDVAVGLVNPEDIADFDMLGDILSLVGDIVEEEDCSVLPISDKVLHKSALDNIAKGVEVYASV